MHMVFTKTGLDLLESNAADKKSFLKALELMARNPLWSDAVQEAFEKAFPGCYQESAEVPSLKKGRVIVDKEGNIVLHRGAKVGRPANGITARFFVIPQKTPIGGAMSPDLMLNPDLEEKPAKPAKKK